MSRCGKGWHQRQEWSIHRGVTKAFLLGAGLGKRLRPLTDRVPKPLVPFFHQPLIKHALQACLDLGLHDVAINTHHLPQVWKESTLGLGGDDWQTLDEYGGNGEAIETAMIDSLRVRLFHEPILLETGGGLRNVKDWMGGDDVLVHNGDIFSTMDLRALMAAHLASGLPVTLALRTQGLATHVAVDETGTRVVDIRNKLGISEGTAVFSGVYCVNASIFEFLPDETIVSVIPAFLELAKRGKLGAVFLDQGHWFDLGERDSYLAAHQLSGFGPLIHPLAEVADGAEIIDSVIGPHARVESGARIAHSVLWPYTRVLADADLKRCIVFSANPASGRHDSCDL